MVNRKRVNSAAVIVSVYLLQVCGMASAGDAENPDALLRFGVEMARKGNWREARFRWERATAIEPSNPGLQNNLGVASEALGDPAAAERYYQRAIELSAGNKATADNLARLKVSQARLGRPSETGEASGESEPLDATAKKRKTVEVTVRLPVPARLDLSGVKTLLVASFLTEETELLDTNRELVRYLRGELRKRTALEVQDVTPNPPVPEQLVDDLASNVEFWKHLGREYGSDLIVSGFARFSRRDASGFQDVDVVSPVTGQKIRQTRFVEREQFSLEIDALFMNGATGELRLRDRVRRAVTFVGLSNDPITAFYELVGAASVDLLPALSQGTRDEPRWLFRK